MLVSSLARLAAAAIAFIAMASLLYAVQVFGGAPDVPPIITAQGPKSLPDFLYRQLAGDLGVSIVQARPVADLIAERLAPTALLAVCGALVAVLLAAPLGIAAGVSRGGLGDRIVVRVAAIVGSVPVVFVAPLLVAIVVSTRAAVPLTGWGTAGQAVMPLIAMVLAALPAAIRLTRHGVAEILDARASARGLRIATHLLAVVLVLAAGLLTAVVIVETVFAIPGLGRLFIQALVQRDATLVAGVLFKLTTAGLLLWLLADLMSNARRSTGLAPAVVAAVVGALLLLLGVVAASAGGEGGSVALRIAGVFALFGSLAAILVTALSGPAVSDERGLAGATTHLGEVRSARGPRLPSLIIGGLLVAGLLVAGIAAIVVGPDPNELSFVARLQPPYWAAGGSREFLFGTDELGRSVAARVLSSIRTALLVGIVAALVAAAIGVPLGLAAGRLGRVVDGIVRSLVAIRVSLAAFLVVLAVTSIVGPLSNPFKLGALLGLLLWDGIAVAVRRAAREGGAGKIVRAAFAGFAQQAALAIVLAEMLSFLGLATQPPASSFGQMMQVSAQFIGQAPSGLVIPGLFLALLLLALHLVADALRSAHRAVPVAAHPPSWHGQIPAPPPR